MSPPLPEELAGMRETGMLQTGVIYDGQRHRHFSMRPAVMADDFVAESLRMPGESSDVRHMATEYMRVNFALIVQQIEFLGGIPKKLLTYEWLVARMPPEDFDAIWRAAEALKKKWLALPEFGATTPPSPDCSGKATA